MIGKSHWLWPKLFRQSIRARQRPTTKKRGKFHRSASTLISDSLPGWPVTGKTRERWNCTDQLLEQHLDRTLQIAKDELVPLYSRQNALDHLAKEIARGFDVRVTDLRASVSTQFTVTSLADRLLAAGGENATIVLLQAAKLGPTLPQRGQFQEEMRQKLKLIDLLIKQHRDAEALATMIALFAPRPYDPGSYGSGRPWEFSIDLITEQPDSSGLPKYPARILVSKAVALGVLPQLVDAIEEELAKHPAAVEQQTIYAVVVVWGRVEKARPFLSRYFERICGLPPAQAFDLALHGSVPGQGSGTPGSGAPAGVAPELLLAMASQLRQWPAARSLAFPALVAAQAEYLRNETEERRFLGLWPVIAAATLALNDLPKAQQVLRKVMELAEADSHSRRWYRPERC